MASGDERLEAGDSIVIAPYVTHQVSPSTDAQFFVLQLDVALLDVFRFSA